MSKREAAEIIDPADYNDFLCITTGGRCHCFDYVNGRAVCNFNGRPWEINGEIDIGCMALYHYGDQIRAGLNQNKCAIEADIKRLKSRGVKVL